MHVALEDIARRLEQSTQQIEHLKKGLTSSQFVDRLHPQEVNTVGSYFLFGLKYHKDELKVEMGEVKTYGGLSLLLEDLLLLLKRWKSASQDPVYFRYLVYIGDDDDEADNEEARKKKLERQCYLNLSPEEKQIGIAAKGFFNVFEDSRRIDIILQEVSHMKQRIHEIISSSGQGLKLKVNTREGDGMMLEDDLITEMFIAAAGLVRALMCLMQQEGYTEDVRYRRNYQENKAFDIPFRIHGILNMWSVLTDLLNERSPEVEDNPKLALLLKRGHYRIKQLQPKSVMRWFDGSRGICGQSSGIIIMARMSRPKIILQLWDTVKRRVTYTISTYNFGCHNVAAFVIKEELFVILLSDPESDHFFFFVLRCKIDAQANDEILDTNSWLQPVLTREVVTRGTCKTVTYQMHEEEDGNLTSFAIFADDSGIHVAFFNPSNGEEIGHEKLGHINVTIEAVKDNMAILFHPDTAEFVVCKFARNRMHIAGKMSLQSIFMELDTEKYKYKKSSFLRATFDQADSNCAVLVSPCGDVAIIEMKSFKVKSIKKKLLAAFQHQHSHDVDDLSLLAKECKGPENCLCEHSKRAQKHLLVHGILFNVANHIDTCSLMAINLEEEATMEMCQFALDSELFARQTGAECSDRSDTNVKLDRRATSYFVPYAFDKSIFSDIRCTDRSRISYMWTLIDQGKYRLHYCPEANTLYIAGVGDSNFVEVKFLREDADGVRARQAKKQREVQAKWNKWKRQGIKGSSCRRH